MHPDPPDEVRQVLARPGSAVSARSCMSRRGSDQVPAPIRRHGAVSLVRRRSLPPVPRQRHPGVERGVEPVAARARGDGASRDVARGVGLGLAHCSAVVRADARARTASLEALGRPRRGVRRERRARRASVHGVLSRDGVPRLLPVGTLHARGLVSADPPRGVRNQASYAPSNISPGRPDPADHPGAEAERCGDAAQSVRAVRLPAAVDGTGPGRRRARRRASPGLDAGQLSTRRGHQGRNPESSCGRGAYVAARPFCTCPPTRTAATANPRWTARNEAPRGVHRPLTPAHAQQILRRLPERAARRHPRAATPPPRRRSAPGHPRRLDRGGVRSAHGQQPPQDSRGAPRPSMLRVRQLRGAPRGNGIAPT